jgi:dihydropteroate synthase
LSQRVITPFFLIMIKQINFSGRLLSLKQPLVMGILNVTADSFFDGGRYLTDDALLRRADQILYEGADILDIGAMSTRPGAEDIPERTEIERIARAVRLVREHFPQAVISVDTWRSSVAETACKNGADMINDVSGGTFDGKMIQTVGKLQMPYCLMHTPAKPDKMQQHTQYEDILKDILCFFGTQLEKLQKAGVHDIIIDPGFGFGKTLEQNYFVLQNLDAFKCFGLPILVGISRKSMICKLIGCTPEQALNGTAVLNTIALMKGTHILRVHDVREAVETRKIVAATITAQNN